jgi:flagellar motor switch protein FliG
VVQNSPNFDVKAVEQIINNARVQVHANLVSKVPDSAPPFRERVECKVFVSK